MTSNIDTRMVTFNKYLNRTNMQHKQYQYEGVEWCLNNELREDPPCNIRGGFIADEMGLGKTIIMIGLMCCNLVNRTLIVVPPILLDQWYLQIYKTTGYKAIIYHGDVKKTLTLAQLSAAHIVITTYGAVTMTEKNLKAKNTTLIHKVVWVRIIFDEAHHLRNSQTIRYTSCRLLPAKIRWLVSGTPIQNSKKDFYSLCALLRMPASFYTENQNLSILSESFLLKRTKKQVGIVISDIHENTSTVEWKNNKEMELAEEIHSAFNFSFVDPSKGNDKLFLENFKKKGQLALLLHAKQSCIYPKLMEKKLDYLVNRGLIKDYATYKDAFNSTSKLDAVINSILSRKDNGCGKLIFCHFREEIDEIAKRLCDGGMTKIATFDGRTNNNKRYEILNEKNDGLILQIQTGCEGLNLQENYSEIYFVSPHWNPAVEDQAIARCHRIGQTKPVYVERFEMCSFEINKTDEETKTIDKYVNEVQINKRTIANNIL